MKLLTYFDKFIDNLERKVKYSYQDKIEQECFINFKYKIYNRKQKKSHLINKSFNGVYNKNLHTAYFPKEDNIVVENISGDERKDIFVRCVSLEFIVPGHEELCVRNIKNNDILFFIDHTEHEGRNVSIYIKPEIVMNEALRDKNLLMINTNDISVTSKKNKIKL